MGKKGGKKSFIDRKEATTFRLLHRSQKDPLIADEQHGERVLHPVESKGQKSKEELEERRKYGIYYNDDYDYLKHLKQVGEAIDVIGAEPLEESEIITADNPVNRLPSCIFETRGVELKVGLLNQAASSNELLPDIDPDVAAALEGGDDLHGADIDSEELEDDFIQLANGGEPLDEDLSSKSNQEMRDESAGRDEMMRRFGLIRRSKERYSDESSAASDEEEMEEKDGGEQDTESLGTTRDDRKSRFTNYSMSSAVIKRADGLRQIDDHFENLYSSQYAEEQEGEGEEEDGNSTKLIDPNNSARFRELLEEEEDNLQQRFPRELPDPELKKAVLRYAEAKETEEEGKEPTERILVPADGAKRGRWDCESIVSTYSNLYNHPKEIREHSLTTGTGSKRKHHTGLPTKSGLNALEKMDVDDGSSLRSSRISTASTFRPKGETPEERRVRKQAIKEERRERRQEKKANQMAFREQKMALDAQRQAVGGGQQIKVRPIH